MIPRTLHQIWLGGPIPEPLAEYRGTWLEHHPGWEHRLWGDDDFGWLTNQTLYDQAEQITSHVEQLRSDLARYEILHKYGGVYCDTDFECLRPIDPLLDTDCFAAWETDGRWVGNAILAAVPGHPLLADLIAEAPKSIEANRGQRPNKLTGPHLLTPLAKRHRITIHPSALFFPYGYDEVGTERERGPFPDAYGVHHWHNTRTGGRRVRV